MNIKTFRKILNSALHPTMDEGTRSNAIRAFDGFMTRNGFTIDNISIDDECDDDDVMFVHQQLAKETAKRAAAMVKIKSLEEQLKRAKSARLSETALRDQEIEGLKAENKALAKEEARLKKENAKLRKKSEATSATESVVSDTGASYTSIDEFKMKARESYGRDYWYSAFAHEAGITVKQLRAWETVDLIPDHLAAKLDDLDEEQRKPASRKQWSLDEVERLKKFLLDGVDYLETARILSREFGRRIFEGSISRRRQVLFREEGWSPAPKSGAFGKVGIHQ